MDNESPTECLPKLEVSEIVNFGSSSLKSEKKLTNFKKSKTWKPWEDHQYISFIKNNLKIFQSQNLRKKKKVFAQMAKKIPTRTAQQCRSHHQKMVIKYGDQQTIARLYKKQRQGKKKGTQSNQKTSTEQEVPSNQNQKEEQALMQVQEIQKDQLLDVFGQLGNDQSYLQLKQNLKKSKTSQKKQKLIMITDNIEETHNSSLFASLLQ